HSYGLPLLGGGYFPPEDSVPPVYETDGTSAPPSVHTPASAITTRVAVDPDNPFPFNTMPVVVDSFELAGAAVGSSIMVYDPNSTTPSPNRFDRYDMDSAATFGSRYGMLVAHQSRTLLLANHRWAHGESLGRNTFGNNAILYTGVFDKERDVDLVSSGTMFGTDLGYGTVASLTASDLLLVGYQRGGLLIQGSVNTPVVRTLSNVTPTFGAQCVPANTPIGTVYGSLNNGVHVWTGGAQSQSLSSQLPGDFWQPAGFDTMPYQGKFESWGDLIFAPNNWVFHIPTQSWWRIEDPDVYTFGHWNAAPYGPHIYGTVVDYEPVDGGTEFIHHAFTNGTPATSYAWASQVIAVTDNLRSSELRELAVMSSGEGEICVTITGLAGNTVTKTLPSTATPRIHRTPIHLDAHAVTLEVTVTSNSTAPAPTIYEIVLAPKADLTIPRTPER
ncbi:MAG: hypothetical protein R3246_13255, partial [Acidimicrobiia bacterium]|nr:hypothetical protein [Acidimicrobiia bacterium]